jgi:hypothetical protein
LSYQKSVRVLKQEVLKICGELTDGNSPFDDHAVDYLDKVHQGLIAGNNLFGIDCMEPWVWAQAKNPILLTLKAAYETGTVTLTNASTSGTFSSAPSISLEGRYLAISGQNDIYRIAQHTAASTSFSLDQAYLETSGSYNYKAYKYDYEAVNDVIIIDSKNCKIDFSEGGSQLTATLTAGSYSPTTLCTEIDTQMTAAGAQSYTVSFNSITRKFTIAQGGATFSLLFATGTNAYISACGVLGFDQEDQTAALTYSSSRALSGICRIPKPLTVYRSSGLAAKDDNKVFQIDDNSFLRNYPLGRSYLGLPDKFCVSEMSRDGLLTLRFNSSVNEDTRVEVPYIPVPASLVDNVNCFPLVPGSFSDFLIYAAAHFIQMDKSDAKATDSLQKAQAQLKALIAFNRQGSQLAGNSVGRLTPRLAGLKRLWGNRSTY